MYKPEVYTKAAKIVANRAKGRSWFACWAISKAANNSNPAYSDADLDFKYWFGPGKREAWFTTQQDQGYESEYGRMVRSIALLFMAEIAKETQNEQ